jgi:hypothetical protein
MPAPRVLAGKADKRDRAAQGLHKQRRTPPSPISLRTPERARAFCERLAETGNVRQVCRELSFAISFVYEWRADVPEFREMWEAAIIAATSLLEEAALLRGVHGMVKPVFSAGQLVGYVREYSDPMLAMLLRAHAPERYRDNVKVEHGGGLNLGNMTDAEIAERITAILTGVGGAPPRGGTRGPADKD